MRDIIDSILIGGLASFLPFWIWDSSCDQIMGALGLKRLEIENKVLRDKIRVAQYLLMDETEKDYRKTPYIFGYLSVLDVSIKSAVEYGDYLPTKVFCIRYADGTVGYALYRKTEAVEDAERKKDMYGGSYTIEEVE